MTSIASSINKIFWGLLIVLIDMNIVFFDLLPDFIGYFMIVSALSDLQTWSAFFSKAKLIAIFLGIISIPLMFQIEINMLYGFQPSAYSLFVLVSSAILGLLHLALIYFIIHGLIELASKHNIDQFGEKAQKRLTTYFIFTIAVMTAFPFVMNVTDATRLFIVVICAVIYIIIEIVILVLIRSLRNQFLHMAKLNDDEK